MWFLLFIFIVAILVNLLRKMIGIDFGKEELKVFFC